MVQANYMDKKGILINRVNKIGGEPHADRRGTQSGEGTKINPTPMGKKASDKKEHVWSPYDQQFTPAPSTSTKPGPSVQFSRPRPTAPIGKVKDESENIGNFRTLSNLSWRKGPMTLPKKSIIKSKLNLINKEPKPTADTMAPITGGQSVPPPM